MATKFTMSQRLRYRVDNLLSRGIWMVLLWLGIIALAFVAIVALVLVILGIGPDDQPTSLIEAIWLTVSRSLDAGTFTGDTGTFFRISSLIVTIVGIFLAATIIGLISSGIDSRVEAIRRGKSIVVETDHTIVIGDSPELPALISELIEANLSERDKAIVLLTSGDPVEVGDEIRSRISDFKTSKFVIRSGNSTQSTDLAMLNPSEARSIVVLRGDDDSDARVVKIVLALAMTLPEGAQTPIVFEIEDPEIAVALQESVKNRVLPVTPREVIARISAQVTRTPGLGAIYEELLDFAGDEMYLARIPDAFVGTDYGTLLMGSSNATILGLRTADGNVLLNPPARTAIGAGDRAIGIAEDDSAFTFDLAPVAWSPSQEAFEPPTPPQIERTLVIGWSDLIPLIAEELESTVAPGSEFHVMVDSSKHLLEEIELAFSLSVQRVVVHQGNPIRKADLEHVLSNSKYDHVLLLSERDDYEAEEADARTLLALMQVRGIVEGTSTAGKVTAELQNPEQAVLGGKQSDADFIVSERLVSLLVAQLSESPDLADVFTEIFDPGGVAISLEPFERFIAPGPCRFEDVVNACRQRDITAIGVRMQSLKGTANALGGGIRLNPAKSAEFTFAPGDEIIVFAKR